ncbi:ATPase with role in protein import into the ER [Podochytrium sp. JEL0797]|nr:ATPase with role in protein import into the ER [Podochytrium sp. JEL0797]
MPEQSRVLRSRESSTSPRLQPSRMVSIKWGGGGERNILVFDLGCGTFDVSVLTIDDGVFEVLATNGDSHLGGEDFDNRLIQHFATTYKNTFNQSYTTDLKSMGKLKREVEKAKRALSTQTAVRLDIESFHKGNDFSTTLSRAKFEELNLDLFKRTLGPVKKVMKDAGLGAHEIHDIVLVGGSTQIPKVVQLLEEYFHGKKASKGINLSFLSDGILDHLVLLNPLSPASKPLAASQLFSTAVDNQPSVPVRVFEGERPLTRNNNLLGQFEMDSIPPAARGTPQIEVTFEVDVNGLLRVSAVDKATGKSESISITSEKDRLSDEEVQRMVEEAELFAEADREVKDTIVAKNGFEDYIYQIQRQVGNEGELGGGGMEIMDAVRTASKWMESNAATATRHDIEEQRAELEDLVSSITADSAAASNGFHENDGDHFEL